MSLFKYRAGLAGGLIVTDTSVSYQS